MEGVHNERKLLSNYFGLHVSMKRSVSGWKECWILIWSNSVLREVRCWCRIDVCNDGETHQSIVKRCRTPAGPQEIHEEHTCKEHENIATSSRQIQGDEGIQVGRVKRKDLHTQIWLLVECKTIRETLKEWHFAKENSRFDSWWSFSRTSGSLHFVTNRGPYVLNERLHLTHADKTKDTRQSCTSSSHSFLN